MNTYFGGPEYAGLHARSDSGGPASPLRRTGVSVSELTDVGYRTHVNPYPSIPPEFAVKGGHIQLSIMPRSQESETVIDALNVVREAEAAEQAQIDQGIAELAAQKKLPPPGILADRASRSVHLEAIHDLVIQLRGKPPVPEPSAGVRHLEASLRAGADTVRPSADILPRSSLVHKASAWLFRAATRESRPTDVSPAEPNLNSVILNGSAQIEFLLDDVTAAAEILRNQATNAPPGEDAQHLLHRATMIEALDGTLPFAYARTSVAQQSAYPADTPPPQPPTAPWHVR